MSATSAPSITDPNAVAKRLLMFGVSQIPEVGEVLEVFVELLWPEDDKPDPWEQIRERTEALINDKLSEDAYSRMSASLEGLKANLDDYNKAMKGDGSAEHKFTAYDTLRGDFNQQLPSFKQEGQKKVLLPLFVQAANLHLSFLRDAHNNGQKLGFSTGETAQIRQELKDTVASHIKYVKDTFKEVYSPVFGPGIDIPFNVQQSSSLYRTMTLDVGDYVILWEYFDPDQSPPSKTPLTREIYSDPLGSIFPNQQGGGFPAGGGGGYPEPGYYPPPPSDQKITKIQFWQGSVFDSMQIWYGNSPTPRMGGPGGTFAGEWTLSDQQHDKLTTVGGDVYFAVRGLYFGFSDGQEMNKGFNATRKFPVPADHYLSSITVVSKYFDHDRGWLHDDLVRMLYFGFKVKPNAFVPPTS